MADSTMSPAVFEFYRNVTKRSRPMSLYVADPYIIEAQITIIYLNTPSSFVTSDKREQTLEPPQEVFVLVFAFFFVCFFVQVGVGFLCSTNWTNEKRNSPSFNHHYFKYHLSELNRELHYKLDKCRVPLCCCCCWILCIKNNFTETFHI